MKILSLNESDPLPALGRKVEQPKPWSQAERDAAVRWQQQAAFETGAHPLPDGTMRPSDRPASDPAFEALERAVERMLIGVDIADAFDWSRLNHNITFKPYTPPTHTWDPMTEPLQVGDEVEAVYLRDEGRQRGKVSHFDSGGHHIFVDYGYGNWNVCPWSKRSSLKLISKASEPKQAAGQMLASTCGGTAMF